GPFVVSSRCNTRTRVLPNAKRYTHPIECRHPAIKFGGTCILYGDFEWKKTSFTMTGSDRTNCNFPVYFGVLAGILYSLGMGIYHAFALHKSRKDRYIGTQMWVMPFILANSLIAVVDLIASCIITVGFAKFCNGITETQVYKSCADGQDETWINPVDSETFNCGYYYRLMTIAQIASWTSFLFWLIHFLLGILRFHENRKLRLHPKSDGTDVSSSKPEISTIDPLS
ncbi:hypothetical protein ScPMuIL_014546, partial [Solemya velum]